jgi:tRNA (adenine37-N6)-methyltransferase
MSDYDQRPGEVRLPFDPAETANDASVVFIGHVRSPWKQRSECPRNIRQARERGLPATVEIGAAWRPGLTGLRSHAYAIVLYWMDQSRRDLIVQAPKHRPDTAGVFAIRSPARPNPIALAIVRILSIDEASGQIEIDAIDCLDGTPVIDIKPWLETVDLPEAFQGT